MNFLESILGLYNTGFGKINFTQGITVQSVETNGVSGLPHKIATVYTCCKVLSENLSRMDMSVMIDNDQGRQQLTRHRLHYLFRYQPNNYQNGQNFWSTVEYHRNYFGNAFVRVHKNRNAYPTSLEIIHPGLVHGYYFEAGRLYYSVFNIQKQKVEEIAADDMLHFRGLSEDGIIGLSPLVAIARQTNINERAVGTLDNFYKNNATTPHALETETLGQMSGGAIGAFKESVKEFSENYTGPENAGKMIRLPMGSKIKTLAMQFADAQLIDTLRFTREDISSAYGLPLFMVDGTAEKLDVEQLTTLFKNNTMGPIVAIYANEINSKLLTPAERMAGITIEFDIHSLIVMDYKTLIEGISTQTKNGLMTLNEAAKKLGNKQIVGEYADMHFVQAQYVPVEKFAQYNPLLKTDPFLKTE